MAVLFTMADNLEASGGAAAHPRGGTRSAAYRAEYYRAKAERLRQMAWWEPPGNMRERLTELAGKYDQLADGLDGGSAPGR